MDQNEWDLTHLLAAADAHDRRGRGGHGAGVGGRRSRCVAGLFHFVQSPQRVGARTPRLTRFIFRQRERLSRRRSAVFCEVGYTRRSRQDL